MRRFFYLVMGIWVVLIRVKRWFVPRPFRVVLVRHRCVVCQRRLRPQLAPRRLANAAMTCKKCQRRLFHQPRRAV